MRKKFTMLFAALLCCVGVAKAATPTEELKASTILPSLGIPEYQFYVRGTINELYWTSTTDDTNDFNSAGKFALYAVPGLQDCYYLYSINDGKWLTYPMDNRNNRHDFIQSADNFDANAYWEIKPTANSVNACYQLRPTRLDKNYEGFRIQEDRYANWFQGADFCSSIGLWQQAPSSDAGSSWSFISVDVSGQLDVLLSQRLAVAHEILAAQTVYAKGEDFLTADNVANIISSPYSDSDEGVIANLVDKNAATCWHSDWHGGETFGGTHYIVANLGENTPDLLSFSYSRRSAADNDHTTRWAVYGVPADESNIKEDSRNGLTLLAMISTPWGNKNEVFNNLPPFKTQGFKKFRIYSEATEQNRGYFHIGEFQLNANTFADSNEDKVKELAAAVATAEALETVTQADIDALNEKIALFGLSDEDKARAQELLNLTGVGYPSANSAARIALQDVLNNPNADVLLLNAAIEAYKTSTEVALPENGKAYQFAMVANNAEKTEYKLTANATTLTAAADATASTFYCVEYTNVDGNKRYAFISEQGNFLGYHALTASYMTHEGANKRLQNDISFSAMTGVSSSNVTSEVADRFGTVTMRVDNRVLGDNGKDGYFILKWSTPAFDKSSAPFHNGTFTSAVKVTEVVNYEPSEAVLKAASTIEHLIKGYNRIGTGIGKYAYTYAGVTGSDFTAFETAIKTAATAVNSSDYSFAINMPAAGFYRIKSMNANDANKKGKYWQSNEAGDAMELSASKDEKRSIVYVSEDFKFLSYGCGDFLNHYTNIVAVADGKSWNVMENASVVGTYALDYPDDGNWCLSDWTGGATYGNNDANAAWIFEEVVSLPVAVTAAGYATLYAPVALTIPAEVKAYTGTVKGDYLTLNAVEGTIPANTGVILEAPQGTYNFAVTADVDAIEGNALTGSAPKSVKNADKKVYTLQNGSNGPGLYRFNGVDGNGNTTYINGFRAWVELDAAAAVNALRITRGDETGIDQIISNDELVIYDLAGRRVEKMEKGIYIVNGKKVVIK